MNIILLALGYSFGWLEGALVVSRFHGEKELGKKGTGNIGASNVAIVLGFKSGLWVAAIDILKAFVPMYVGRTWFDLNLEALAFLGIGVVIGHIFPLPFHFRGGKGAASMVGLGYGLSFNLGLMMHLVFLLFAILSDYIFIGSLSVFIFLPLILWFTSGPTPAFYLSLILAGIGFYKHRTNLKNLREGKEIGLRNFFTNKKNAKKRMGD